MYLVSIQVEFDIMQEPNGRFKALNVTGPNGSFVQGAPRRSSFGGDNYGNDERY